MSQAVFARYLNVRTKLVQAWESDRTTEGTLTPAQLKRELQRIAWRSEEHTSELQSRSDLVCRLLLEKKKKAAQPFRGGHVSETADCPVVTPLTRHPYKAQL